MRVVTDKIFKGVLLLSEEIGSCLSFAVGIAVVRHQVLESGEHRGDVHHRHGRSGARRPRTSIGERQSAHSAHSLRNCLIRQATPPAMQVVPASTVRPASSYRSWITPPFYAELTRAPTFEDRELVSLFLLYRASILR